MNLLSGFMLTIMRVSSHGESHWVAAEVDRDYEAVESAHQAPSDQPSHAGNEHGDDEGVCSLVMPASCLSFVLAIGWYSGRDDG